mgnify:FL=1
MADVADAIHMAHKRGNHSWLVRDDERLWYVDYVQSAPDTGRPECMAFKARFDKAGDLHVTNFQHVAVSYLTDPGAALVEVMRQLEVTTEEE